MAKPKGLSEPKPAPFAVELVSKPPTRSDYVMSDKFTQTLIKRFAEAAAKAKEKPEA